MVDQKIQAEGQLERAGGKISARVSYPASHGRRACYPIYPKSETVQLREYEGHRVRINASLVEGCPPNEEERLWGEGAKLLEVFSIASLQQEEER
jgi:hypothetical protein